MAIHPTATAAGLGMLLGSAVGSASAVWAARLRPHAAAVSWTAMRELVRASVSLCGLYALINLDVVLARHYLGTAESGAYAVGSLVAKIAFFLPSFVIYVLFPAMSASPSRRVRVAAVGGTLAVGAAVAGACAVAAPYVVWVAGGPQYHDMAPLIWLYAVQGTVFAVLQALVLVRLSAERGRATWMAWAACLAFAILVWRWHASITAILLASIGVGLLLAVAMLVSALAPRRRPTPQDIPRPAEATVRSAPGV
jgi:O-antigen/teichoic acid export membrane protein